MTAYNPMELTGRGVLVTGASSGLGRATAVLLSRLGARVFLIGRDETRLQETLRALEGQGHDAMSFDLNQTEKIPGLLVDLAGRFLPFSGVVHAAGNAQLKPLRVCRPQDLDDLHRIHVVAASQLLRGLTKRGVTAPGGCSVVILGSIASLRGASGMASYCTAKAAVLGLIRAAALELAQDKIRVNAVLPGYCETAMTDGTSQLRSAEHVQKTIAEHPLGVGRPEDVANAVAFLIADTARWITGSSLVVDGGFTAH
jgi:NAD(P)-dependent dehydrogenase (short-subunit alcohol dehydrogenase family)